MDAPCKDSIMKFVNQEVMDKFLAELSRTTNLDSEKKVRCFLNYLRLVDKCYSLEPSRVEEKIGGAWHHILPRSLYPEYIKPILPLRSNFNEVRMTHKEHFVAHHLLYEIYGRSGPMAAAFKMILGGRFTKSLCNKNHLELLLNFSYRHSEETKSRISESMRGKQNSKGRKDSDETKAKLSAAKLGNTYAEGNTHSEETRAKMSESKLGNQNCIGRVLSEETRAKMSESQRGNQNSKGTVLSDEAKSRISESMKNRPRVDCPHCGKSGSSNAMRRWHFDNCRMKEKSDA